jgi:hypothetical protein
LSSIHYTLVGHFDPRSVFIDGVKNLAVSRPLARDRVEALLAEYPELVAAQVRLEEGYARCQWAPSTMGEEVFELAYRLARLEGCLAVENGRQVMFPIAAVRAQAEIWERTQGPAGLADKLVSEASQYAEAFDERLRQREAGRKPHAARLAKALDEIARRRFAHARRGGCFVKDEAGWPSEDVVRETLEACGGDHATCEDMLNRRFVLADVLDPIAPGEAWSAGDVGAAAKALASALQKQLAAQFPGQGFDVEIVGAHLAEEEPAEVGVTFRRAG